jgi:hypothetical protein
MANNDTAVIVHMPGTALSPATVLSRCLCDAENYKAVVVLAIRHDGHVEEDHSLMTLAEMSYAHRVLDGEIRDLMKELA